MPSSGLSPRQQKLADCVLAGMTLAEAHKAAGYSGKNANVRAADACRTLKKANLVAYMQQQHTNATEAAASDLKITKETVLTWLAEHRKMAITEKTLNLSAANTAASLIGKELGMFVDRSEVTTFDVAAMKMTDLYAEAQQARDQLTQTMVLLGVEVLPKGH